MSRPPNHEFQEWWNKQRETAATTSTTAIPTASENPSLLSIEIRSPDSLSAAAAAAGGGGGAADSPFGKDRIRARSARQLSFFYLLKLQQLLHSLSSIFSGFIHLLRTATPAAASTPSTSPRQPPPPPPSPLSPPPPLKP